MYEKDAATLFEVGTLAKLYTLLIELHTLFKLNRNLDVLCYVGKRVI